VSNNGRKLNAGRAEDVYESYLESGAERLGDGRDTDAGGLLGCRELVD
jgi:hypothetical protein